MVTILDGKKARDSYKKRLIERSKALTLKPTLALIQIGNNRESNIYISQKKKFAEEIGAQVEHVIFPDTATIPEITKKIIECNEKDTVHGIIIQLPLPQHLDPLTLINTINPEKDVDGLTDTNQNLLKSGKQYFIPATARGVLDLIRFYNIDIIEKNITVFGRSRLVGGPIAHLLATQGSHVSVCHSKTLHPKEIAKHADIVIVAIGKPEYIDSSYIKKDAIVIDVGINSILGEAFEHEIPKRKLVGDVNQRDVEKLVKAISPVPGGVGPMTVLSLFANLIESAERMCRKA